MIWIPKRNPEHLESFLRYLFFPHFKSWKRRLWVKLWLLLLKKIRDIVSFQLKEPGLCMVLLAPYTFKLLVCCKERCLQYILFSWYPIHPALNGQILTTFLKQDNIIFPLCLYCKPGTRYIIFQLSNILHSIQWNSKLSVYILSILNYNLFFVHKIQTKSERHTQR